MKPEDLKLHVRGLLPVMITPCKPNYDLDEEGLATLARHVIGSASKGEVGALLAAGSGGECSQLSDDERKRVFEVLVDAAGDVPVIAGCNHSDTRAVIRLAQHAEKVGAAGVMITPPYYWPPSPDAIVMHISEVAKAIGIGIMFYNNSAVTQVDASLETIGKLAEIPNVVAVKENSVFLARVGDIITRFGDRLAIVNGKGRWHEPYAHMLGSKGLVTAEASVLPAHMCKFWRALDAKRYDDVLEMRRQLMPMRDFMMAPPRMGKYIAVHKAALDMLGLPGGPVRPPVTPMLDEEKEHLRGLLKDLGVDV